MFDLLLLGKALVLGLVEGATEFLPVSSTGHLILVGDWLNFTGEQAKSFTVFIQLGAILAIVWLYRDTVLHVAMGWRRDAASRRLLINLGVAFLPAALIGFAIYDWIKAHLFNPITVACALVAGGIAILAIERWSPRARVESLETIPLGTALGIGIAQILSLFPGVSRSGATIMGAYGLGLSRTVATEFSFFLAIPIMFAATIFDVVDSLETLSLADLPVFAVGFLVSFVSALVVVKGFLAFVSRNSFRSFAWYRIVFGLALLGFYLLAL